jgi:hypothetical protein
MGISSFVFPSGLTSDSVIFGYHARSESSERLLAEKGASGIHSQGNLPGGASNVKREVREFFGETWKDA